MKAKVIRVVGIYLVLLLVLVAGLLASNTVDRSAYAASTGYDSPSPVFPADDPTPTYPIMPITPEQKRAEAEWLKSAPLATIDQEIVRQLEARTQGASVNLLSRTGWTSANMSYRNQGNAGNCWVWAGTGVMEVAHNVQQGITDRLSIQYFDSNYNNGSGVNWAGCGGEATPFASFYNTKKIAIPWSNTNAYYQDGSRSCASGGTLVPAANISTSPSYSLSSVTAALIPTYNIGDTTPITNIKSYLNQNKAVYFGFYLANTADWNDFYTFWYGSAESVIWPYSFSCGEVYEPPPSGGGHAVLCVGYNDDDADPANHYWLMLNSWSTTAGRPNGLFRIPMHYVYNCADSLGGANTEWWTINPTFATTPVPTITVTSPNGAESWNAGSTHSVTWTYSSMTDTYVNINLLQNGTSVWSAYSPIGSAGSGSYSWAISPTQSAGSNYRIKVSGYQTPSVSDTSNADFTINGPPPPSITVTSPNGAESWNAGSTHSVTWSYSSMTDTYVNINLLQNGNSVWSAYSPIGSAGSGSYSWAIPTTQSSGSNYRIKVSGYQTPSVFDTSNADFTINGPPPPNITVTSPNGAESWNAGSTHSVTWSYSSMTDTYVNINLLQNGTSVWSAYSPIGSAGSGSYSWAISPTQSAGSNYRIKVSGYQTPSVSDTSNADFTINGPPPPNITVTSPNGSEVWVAGTTHSVTWTFSSMTDTYVNINLLQNGTSVWSAYSPIGSAGSGSYSWAIPPTQSTGSNYRIKVSGYQTPSVSDTSNADFTINGPPPPNITVTSPNGAESWNAGTTHSVTWTYASMTDTYVNINLLQNGTSVWSAYSPIGSAGSGSYSWTIPPTQSSGSNYRIKVSGYQTPSVSDTSNADFTINGPPPPNITVTSPNGGESWNASSTHNVTWTYANMTDSYVNINLLQNGNSVWSTYAPIGSAGSGSYSWTIPPTQSTGSNYRIKVSGYQTPSVFDTSNADFTISN